MELSVKELEVLNDECTVFLPDVSMEVKGRDLDLTR